jgi:hypothetical protein
MNGTCNMHERDKKLRPNKNSLSENLKRRNQLEDLCIDRRIILIWTWKK